MKLSFYISSYVLMFILGVLTAPLFKQRNNTVEHVKPEFDNHLLFDTTENKELGPININDLTSINALAAMQIEMQLMLVDIQETLSKKDKKSQNNSSEGDKQQLALSNSMQLLDNAISASQWNEDEELRFYTSLAELNEENKFAVLKARSAAITQGTLNIMD